MILMENVNKYFGEHHVLKNINLNIESGEKVVIIGPSGSGKSTLIRCMNRLEEVTDGVCNVYGVDIVSRNAPIQKVRQKVAMVFQNFNLYSHLTVLENVTLAPIKLQNVSKKEAEATGRKFLKRVGLEDRQDSYPSQLSGGQKQRVAIARALNMHPEVILFDEPTSALDPETIQEVLDVIAQLSEMNITMVIVTHEIGFAKEVADRIIFMEQGELVIDAPPNEFFSHTENPRIQEFLGKIIHY